MKTRCLKQLSVALLVVLFVGCPAFATTSTTLAISQVYSSQFSSALVSNDFIELFNLGSTTVNLTGWTLQYSAQDTLTWTAYPLTGSILPGQYYLLGGAKGTGSFALPTPDSTTPALTLDPVGGRLALVNDNVLITSYCTTTLTDVVDFASYGSSTKCSSISPAIDNDDSMVRAGGGCTDTGSNIDFSVVPPYPRNSTATPNTCGLSAAAALQSFSVPANGGFATTTPGAGSTLTVGAGFVQPASGSSTPSGVAIFGLRQNGVLVTEAGVPAAPLVSNALLYVEVNGAITTGIAITNPNSQAVTISFQFNDSTKSYYQPEYFGSLVVPANGQLARFVTQLPYALPAGVLGTLQMTASAPVGIVALRGYTNQQNNFLVTTLPVIDLSQPASTNPTYLAQFAAQGGWITEVALINPSGAQVTGTISFVSPSGQPMSVTVGTLTASSFTYTIPALNSTTIIVGGTGTAIQTGSISISLTTGSATPVGLAVYSYVQNNVRVSEAGIVGVTGSAFRTYVEASGTSGAVGSIQSGVAIANTGTSSATITLQLMGLDGSTGPSTTISIPASGQVSEFLNQLFPALPGTFTGILRTSTTGSISMVGLRSRTNEAGNFLITTVPPVSESASTSNQVVFPQFADSGGYTTQFILYGPAGQSSSGNIKTLSPGGQPLPPQ